MYDLFCLQVGAHSVDMLETLVRTCPDVTKLTSPVLLQPSDLGPATLSKYLIRRCEKLLFLLIIIST